MMADLNSRKTIWGLDAKQIHAAWWSGFGVQVVHQGMGFDEEKGAEVYLLLSTDQLVQFDLSDVVEAIVWTSMDSVKFRIVAKGKTRYREELVRNDSGSVQGVKRSYGYSETEIASVEFTKSEDIAKHWAESKAIPHDEMMVKSSERGNLDHVVFGHAFDFRRRGDCEDYIQWIIAIWPDPHRVIRGIEEVDPGIFAAEGTSTPAEGIRIATAWLGEVGMTDAPAVLVGPAFLWDDQEHLANRKAAVTRVIREIPLPEGRQAKRLLPRATLQGAIKRVFDFSVALVLLMVLAPIGILVAILIIIDNGTPLFFGHVRQARGGRDFKCWKFRTMRKNAESMVIQLQDQNKADGPQVFIENDPRVTRVGRVLRKLQMDELPQLWNVLRGDMSLVGPRPSPDRENQFCPAWREIRLSVRPGITGLWQVRRTRAAGEDFLEWIKYDIEYVQRASFLLDIKILFKTFGVLIDRK